MMGRSYIEVPGSGTHELPPLLVHSIPEDASREYVVERAAAIVETEDMIADASPDSLDRYSMDQRKFDLALHLTDQYFGLLAHWAWGDSVLEWVRQCEITFAATTALRPLWNGDVWPHAARTSFVDLLLDKHVSTPGVAIDKAVGTRLTFRQPPPIDCCSNQFLFFLNGRLAGTAYETWARMSPESAGHLPPNRFHFEIHDMRPQ
jgi:hypothetical protein